MGDPSFIKQAYGVCYAVGPQNPCYEETKQLTQCSGVLAEEIPPLL
jgi:hypothetical protein